MTEARSHSLARVGRGDLCSGCGGCAALVPDRIVMRLDTSGFLRPGLRGAVTPAEDEAIARICPGLGQQVAAGARRDDPLWGPFVALHTGHATDAALRHAGASGGGLSAVAAWLLDSGRVDAVIQTAADPGNPLGNRTVVSRNRAEVLAAAGSRYAPAAPLEGLRTHLIPGARHAFVGKPCDVAALRALMAEDPGLGAAIPVVLSFFCAGTPSLRGARAVVERMGADPEAVRAFRYRGMGWPGRARACLADGSTREMSYHDSWGMILSRYVQHRCRICADGTGVAADLAFADAWEADAEGYPLFEEAEGRSLIVARNEQGMALLDAAVAAGVLAIERFDPAALAAIQPGQRKRRQAVLARLAALRLSGRPVPRYRGLGLWSAARRGGALNALREFLGMLRRIWRKGAGRGSARPR
ncbi:MAG: Coenzyme F420 hydrogenase/dehydrogenase, beta subunit C-terminal domain [Gemmobacter sp.]